MKKNFIKIYTGSPINVLALKNELAQKNIIPIVKDNAESARLGGFGIISDLQQVFVHKDQVKESKKIVTFLF